MSNSITNGTIETREDGLRARRLSSTVCPDYSAAEQSSRNRLSYKDTFNGLVREYTLSVEFQSKLAPCWPIGPSAPALAGFLSRQ